MNFKLDAAWDGRAIVWSFVPQDSRAEALLDRLGFRDVFHHHEGLSLRGPAAVAAGRMLRACGATFGESLKDSERPSSTRAVE